MPKLNGLRIVVTRAAHQAEELAQPLRSLGADVILLPVIGIAPPENTRPLREAAKNADQYDWIIFTSANAVDAFFSQQLEIAKPRIAAIGSATREAVEAIGLSVDLVPEKYVAESLTEAFHHQRIAGSRILIPSAAITRDVVPAALRDLGAQVDVVEAYRNVIPSEAAALAQQLFQEPYPDWITFASSSAVDHLVQLTGAERLRHSKIATIGPITSNTVRKHGLAVNAEAAAHTVEGIVEAIRSFLA